MFWSSQGGTSWSSSRGGTSSKGGLAMAVAESSRDQQGKDPANQYWSCLGR